MRKIALLFLLLPMVAFAGEYVDLPYDVVISDPLTDKVEKMSIKFKFYQDGNHHAVLTYRLLNNDRTKVIDEYSFIIRNVVDDPGTPENEATTDFTDFILGFGGTLDSRAATAMNQDLQSRRETQAKP